MTVKYVKSLRELERLLPRDMAARERRIKRAVERTARRGAALVRRNVPVAFGELRDGVQAVENRIIADSPHAAAVEKGSRPHVVPLEPLIRWVKLRGAQGLSGRSMKRLSGTTTAVHAKNIASRLRELSIEYGGVRDANSVDDPVTIARAIQAAIAKHGTKPHHYMQNSIPAVMEILDEEIKAAMPESESARK